MFLSDLKIVADYLGTYISADFVLEFHGIADAPFHIIYIDGETVKVHFHYTDIEDFFSVVVDFNLRKCRYSHFSSSGNCDVECLRH